MGSAGMCWLLMDFHGLKRLSSYEAPRLHESLHGLCHGQPIAVCAIFGHVFVHEAPNRGG